MIRIKKANQLPCFLEPVPFWQAGMGHQLLFAAPSFPKACNFSLLTFGSRSCLGLPHDLFRKSATFGIMR
jgi:hypothetical protein